MTDLLLERDVFCSPEIAARTFRKCGSLVGADGSQDLEVDMEGLEKQNLREI